MFFTAVARLQLDTQTAIGVGPVEGRALVFTPDDADNALASVDESWRESLPRADFWRNEAPDATWCGAFAPTDQRRIPPPPPNEGDRFLLTCGDGSYPGTVLNDTMGEGEPKFERYFIAGMGDVPVPPEGIGDAGA